MYGYGKATNEGYGGLGASREGWGDCIEGMGATRESYAGCSHKGWVSREGYL